MYTTSAREDQYFGRSAKSISVRLENAGSRIAKFKSLKDSHVCNVEVTVRLSLDGAEKI